MLDELTRHIVSGESLSREESRGALEILFEPHTTDVAIASFLTALSSKGETAEEIAGFAQGMREHAVTLRATRENLVDTAGTGGGAASFNVSTTAAFVIAGAGVPVAKHGNRAATSRSGSADLLEALGVRIDAPLETVQNCLDRNGLAFLFAPAFHPAMKRVAGIRKQIPHRTVFNLLGPLTNPAGASYQLIGVFDAKLAPLLGRALQTLGTRRSWIVHSRDDLDEVSVRSVCDVVEVTPDSILNLEIRPQEHGFRYDGDEMPEEFAGGSPKTNAQICLDILGNKRQDELTDLVTMNAAAAIQLASDEPLGQAIERARQSLADGLALRQLEKLIETSNGR